MIVSAMSQVQSYRGILACRFFLGIIEAGFFPGVLYIMTCWYKRNEIGMLLHKSYPVPSTDCMCIGKRFCFFFTALCFAGAASGLISGAVIGGLEGHNGMRGWRWLFLIEGVISIGVAFVASFILPDYPHTATKRLTKEERTLALVRIMHDRAEAVTGKRKLTPFESVKAAASDLRTYFFIILYMTQNGSTTVSYFIPTVLESMGYEGTEKQWMTVPIWAVSQYQFFNNSPTQTNSQFHRSAPSSSWSSPTFPTVGAIANGSLSEA